MLPRGKSKPGTFSKPFRLLRLSMGVSIWAEEALFSPESNLPVLGPPLFLLLRLQEPSMGAHICVLGLPPLPSFPGLASSASEPPPCPLLRKSSRDRFGLVDGASACGLRGPGFDSGQGHVPGLRAYPQWEMCRRQLIDVSLSSMFLALCLSPFLSVESQ
uniref:Uncharacterized protein n=1 Tax=Myotis myotis TaxID=51298 RepID=A0A7J7TTR0_MYOMY|nr:hypothetical protein mMyoMyo1_008954 [Myotis myotis]